MTDEQYTEIQDEIAASVKQIRLDLESAPKNKKDLAIAFGRRFEELEDQEIDSVLNVLRNRKERCEK